MIKKIIACMVLIFFLVVSWGLNTAEALVINEIHFNPSFPVEDDDGEFLELFNEGLLPVDMTGYSIAGITVNFEGIILNPESFMVLASELLDDSDTDRESFEAIYGDGDGLLTEFTYITLDFSGSLANAGELLTIYGHGGEVIDRYDYTPFIGSGADGGGFSIERIDPLKPSEDINLSVSEVPGGTPGMWNSVAEQPGSGDVTSVPEPPTYLLLIAGLLLLISLTIVKRDYLPLVHNYRTCDFPEKCF